MANRINQPVVINGEKHWITAKTAQEFADKVAALTGAVSCSETQQANKHPFDEYAWNWYYTYSEPNIATVTAVTYKRQIEKYLIPAFAELAVEEVTPDHIQRLFNSMETSKATKDKLRTVLNQILEAAIEDKIIASNPLKSKKVKITGTASKSTEPYSVSQMQYLAQHLDNVKKDQDRAFLAISIFHPLRPEEVLGLKGADIDRENMTITIRRAVTHPLRNQPEIKEVKTVGSARTITLSAQAMPHIPETHFTDFIFGGKKPASYTIVRGMCRRIKKDVLFDENITPKRFRTTVLTDMYDQTKDIKLVQAAAGHATSAMTLKHYVKGRQTDERGAAAIEKLYTA